MFWQINFPSSESNLLNLLDNEDTKLEEILNEDDIIQECKAQNSRLIKYLQKPEILEELLSLIINCPPQTESEPDTFSNSTSIITQPLDKAKIASEILISDNTSIYLGLINNENLIKSILSYYTDAQCRKPNQNVLEMLGKILIHLVTQSPQKMNQYLDAHTPNFLQLLNALLEYSPIIDLIVHLASQLETQSELIMYSKWFVDKRFLPNILLHLDPRKYSENVHENIQFILAEIFSNSTEFTCLQPHQYPKEPIPLVRQILSVNTFNHLFHWIFLPFLHNNNIDKTETTALNASQEISSIANTLKILVALLEYLTQNQPTPLLLDAIMPYNCQNKSELSFTPSHNITNRSGISISKDSPPSLQEMLNGDSSLIKISPPSNSKNCEINLSAETSDNQKITGDTPPHKKNKNMLRPDQAMPNNTDVESETRIRLVSSLYDTMDEDNENIIDQSIDTIDKNDTVFTADDEHIAKTEDHLKDKPNVSFDNIPTSTSETDVSLEVENKNLSHISDSHNNINDNNSTFELNDMSLVNSLTPSQLPAYASNESLEVTNANYNTSFEMPEELRDGYFLGAGNESHNTQSAEKDNESNEYNAIRFNHPSILQTVPFIAQYFDDTEYIKTDISINDMNVHSKPIFGRVRYHLLQVCLQYVLSNDWVLLAHMHTHNIIPLLVHQFFAYPNHSLLHDVVYDILTALFANLEKPSNNYNRWNEICAIDGNIENNATFNTSSKCHNNNNYTNSLTEHDSLYDDYPELSCSPPRKPKTGNGTTLNFNQFKGLHRTMQQKRNPNSPQSSSPMGNCSSLNINRTIDVYEGLGPITTPFVLHHPSSLQMSVTQTLNPNYAILSDLLVSKLIPLIMMAWKAGNQAKFVHSSQTLKSPTTFHTSTKNVELINNSTDTNANLSQNIDGDTSKTLLDKKVNQNQTEVSYMGHLYLISQMIEIHNERLPTNYKFYDKNVSLNNVVNTNNNKINSFSRNSESNVTLCESPKNSDPENENAYQKRSMDDAEISQHSIDHTEIEDDDMDDINLSYTQTMVEWSAFLTGPIEAETVRQAKTVPYRRTSLLLANNTSGLNLAALGFGSPNNNHNNKNQAFNLFDTTNDFLDEDGDDENGLNNNNSYGVLDEMHGGFTKTPPSPARGAIPIPGRSGNQMVEVVQKREIVLTDDFINNMDGFHDLMINDNNYNDHNTNIDGDQFFKAPSHLLNQGYIGENHSQVKTDFENVNDENAQMQFDAFDELCQERSLAFSEKTNSSNGPDSRNNSTFSSAEGNGSTENTPQKMYSQHSAFSPAFEDFTQDENINHKNYTTAVYMDSNGPVYTTETGAYPKRNKYAGKKTSTTLLLNDHNKTTSYEDLSFITKQCMELHRDFETDQFNSNPACDDKNFDKESQSHIQQHVSGLDGCFSTQFSAFNNEPDDMTEDQNSDDLEWNSQDLKSLTDENYDETTVSKPHLQDVNIEHSLTPKNNATCNNVTMQQLKDIQNISDNTKHKKTGTLKSLIKTKTDSCVENLDDFSPTIELADIKSGDFLTIETDRTLQRSSTPENLHRDPLITRLAQEGEDVISHQNLKENPTLPIISNMDKLSLKSNNNPSTPNGVIKGLINEDPWSIDDSSLEKSTTPQYSQTTNLDNGKESTNINNTKDETNSKLMWDDDF